MERNGNRKVTAWHEVPKKRRYDSPTVSQKQIARIGCGEKTWGAVVVAPIANPVTRLSNWLRLA